ncbi:hypothetical protein PROFUN_09171 [Planoprotostelium fungivorum]|uniref:PH domain-containing protein n=1 Tax=Planoprotostelium fungivorum TaxID=1890364 RepID=A0A2P6MVL7_9EUKA|nr:hypothetical protein PROFUN_09171 [Planoprotostelium fungivorum]
MSGHPAGAQHKRSRSDGGDSISGVPVVDRTQIYSSRAGAGGQIARKAGATLTSSSDGTEGRPSSSTRTGQVDLFPEQKQFGVHIKTYKEGYLDKYATTGHKLFKNWKTRYFVMYRHQKTIYLCYFLSQIDFLEGRALNMINLNISTAAPLKTEQRKHCISIENDQVSLWVDCKTQENFQSWMEKFNQISLYRFKLINQPHLFSSSPSASPPLTPGTSPPPSPSPISRTHTMPTNLRQSNERREGIQGEDLRRSKTQMPQDQTKVLTRGMTGLLTKPGKKANRESRNISAMALETPDKNMSLPISTLPIAIIDRLGLEGRPNRTRRNGISLRLETFSAGSSPISSPSLSPSHSPRNHFFIPTYRALHNREDAGGIVAKETSIGWLRQFIQYLRITLSRPSCGSIGQLQRGHRNNSPDASEGILNWPIEVVQLQLADPSA